MKRVYLSGPMSGLEDFNYPTFHAAAEYLRLQGFAVINPAELAGDKPLDWREYMRQDLRWLLDCDLIAVLPGWRQSRGARIEVATALALGLGVINAWSCDAIDVTVDLVFTDA